MAAQNRTEPTVFGKAGGAALGVFLLCGLVPLSGESGEVNGSIGLVISYLNLALYQTPDGKEECPEGFHHTQNDNFMAQFPTEEARETMLKKYIYYTHRGPNGEDVFYHPTVIQDPLPLRDIQGSTGLGIDLDGRVDSDDFNSPTGKTGIDNQIYRVVGCIPGLRNGGTIDGSLKTEIRASHKMRMLVEITGIDDFQNDDQVTVSMYRGLDGIEVAPDNTLVPFRSQRIDYVEGQRYIHQLSGRLEDGVLKTEPKDVMVPMYGPFNIQRDIVLRDARFELNLTDTGAEGFLGGYFDIENWYGSFAKIWGAHFNADVTGWSGPATYAGLYRFADAYPDDEGRNTAISGAYKLEFVRAFVIHDPAKENTGRTVAAESSHD
ncbi:MAG: hypothetical protein CMK32_11360 [Porticoccaceae bacterium]|nr:hypothetical protein [Porticoccaceae bacterium]